MDYQLSLALQRGMQSHWLPWGTWRKLDKGPQSLEVLQEQNGFSHRNVVGDVIVAGAATCKEGRGSFGVSPGPVSNGRHVQESVWRSGFDDRSWRTGWNGHPWRWGIIKCNVTRHNMNGTVDREGYLS